MRLRNLAALVFVFAATAQATTARSPKDAASSDLVWPPPPDPPKVRFVQTLQGSRDYAKKPSTLRRVLLGPEREEGIQLKKHEGKPIGESAVTKRSQSNANRAWLGSPWEFKQRGQSGLWVSELFPHIAQVAAKSGPAPRQPYTAAGATTAATREPSEE